MLKKKKEFFFKVKNIKISVTSSVSYVIDWLLYSSLLICFTIFRICSPPRYHEFALDDNNYSYTFYNDQLVFFANKILLLISLLIPIIYIIVQFSIPKKTSIIRKLWNIHCALLAFLASHTFQVIIVSILKNILGLPRPDMLKRCMPRSFSLAPIGSLSNVSICGNIDIAMINDGFRSFPSGHASTSFCSSTFTFFIFATRNSIFEKRYPSYKIVLGLLPFIISLFVSATRFSDNRHFLIDLFFGAKIGILSSFIGYHLYFPWYKSCGCNQGNAYPPRRVSILKSDKFKFWKLPDDDEYDYDSDAIEIDDDSSIHPYNDDETSLSSNSTRNFNQINNKIQKDIINDESYKDTQRYHKIHHHTHKSKSRPQSKKENNQPLTQKTTYTIKLKDNDISKENK